MLLRRDFLLLSAVLRAYSTAGQPVLTHRWISPRGFTSERYVVRSSAGSGAAEVGHRLLGSARIASGDRIEPERSAQPQNMHLNLWRELGRVAAKRRYGVSE
jgi:hypothetical protein